MFTRDQYELIDFGNGRRLERLGELVLDRPCPAVEGAAVGNPSLWRSADVRFVEQRGKRDGNRKDSNAALGFRGVWKTLTPLGAKYFSVAEHVDSSKGQQADKISSLPWIMPFADRFAFELKGSPFGHVGVFPEQAENWDRIYDLCAERLGKSGVPARVLNLFGYTGGSALAAAAAGAEVTHLDAARNVVAQAKRNAAESFGVADSVAQTESPADSASVNADVPTIRWIVDDAVKFVKREIKRESRYNGVILDPPTYGHGARGEVWRLSRDLEPLVENCVALLDDSFAFVLLSGHTPNFEYPVLGRILRTALRNRFGQDVKLQFLTKPLGIASRCNGVLPAGDMALAILRR